MMIRNAQLRPWIEGIEQPGQLRSLWRLLESRGVLDFPCLENGLFPAAVVNSDTEYTGYANVWIRDNVHVAHAHHVAGRTPVAVRNVESLMSFLLTQRRRFQAIIDGEADPAEAMNRPHIRFDGPSLAEIPCKWPHAQNDALGYFLWFYCRLAREGCIEVSIPAGELLGLFPRYFRAIRFWEDEDSGHWEERRKVSASSIGVVVAGLRELQRLGGGFAQGKLLECMIENGQAALRRILPWECRQSDAQRRRRYDAALLYLIYPLEVVTDAMADRILADVNNRLRGDHGIRRYLGDSFWAPDYKRHLAPELRTADMGDDMARRDALAQAGGEAQWCIFDPVVSVIHGRRYRATRKPEHRRLQIEHLCRSLGQITGQQDPIPWKCPELYYLENGQYVPNDATPLLWTQANLILALKAMDDTLAEI